MRCGGVLPMPWAAPLVAVVVMAIGWIHAPPRRWWQVAVPDGGRRSAARPSAGRGLAVLGDDRGQVGGGEPQVLAEEGARDLPGGGPATQPRFADTQLLGRLGRRVEELVWTEGGDCGRCGWVWMRRGVAVRVGRHGGLLGL